MPVPAFMEGVGWLSPSAFSEGVCKLAEPQNRPQVLVLFFLTIEVGARHTQGQNADLTCTGVMVGEGRGGGAGCNKKGFGRCLLPHAAKASNLRPGLEFHVGWSTEGGGGDPKP